MAEDWILGRGPETLFLGLLLAAARPLAFIFVLPLFNRFDLQAGLIRGAVMLAFAAPVFPSVVTDLAALPPPSMSALLGLLVKELLLGLLLGLILGLPLWAVVAAGDFIDMQRGAQMATLADPGAGEEVTVTGTVFFLMIALILVTSGWFTEVLLETLYESYAGWPVLRALPPLTPEAGAAALGLLDNLLETGLVLAIPVVGTMLLAEVALGLAARYTQALNAMFVAMSLKQAIYVLVLPVYFASLVYFTQGEVRELGGALSVLEGFVGR